MKLVSNNPYEDLNIGKWVLMKRKKKTKFMSEWLGPFKVVRKPGVGTYHLADHRGNILLAHVTSGNVETSSS
jgi:hypothetical protein